VGLAVIAGGIVFLMLPGPDLSDLARVEPLPAQPVPEGAGPFEQKRSRGMALYAAGEYAGARQILIEALALRPDETVALYLGSAELLLGLHDEAADRLEGVAQLAVDPALRQEILWQLANARLLIRSSGEAEQILDLLATLDGPRNRDAAALLRDIRGVR
jgi:tetratricopeptide (TPR) repeat protein